MVKRLDSNKVESICFPTRWYIRQASRDKQVSNEGK